MAGSDTSIDVSLIQQNNSYWCWQRQAECQNQVCHRNQFYEQHETYFSAWSYDCDAGYSNYGLMPCGATQNPSPTAEENSTWTPALSEFQEAWIATDYKAEEPVADPDIYLNVDELNRELVARSEDLYDSLINSQWQPLDTVTSRIPSD